MAMDKSRFDRLHVKLFLAIAGAIAALTFAAYLVFSWSFERGFVQYLNRADEARLELMIDRLADGYAREGGWDWIAQGPRPLDRDVTRRAGIAAAAQPSGPAARGQRRDAAADDRSAAPAVRRRSPAADRPTGGRARGGAEADHVRRRDGRLSRATCRGSSSCSRSSACICAAST